ncbi:Hypothetical predicted protein [Paramuricea clavata]|uniref:Uncharacterized protein n=1 Tax=Paramuricea clavata TaxID=317549 RepID=A0A6S7H726_PARCT|nr:Hypothetical predicted protein [Paramuricea clavata]
MCQIVGRQRRGFLNLWIHVLSDASNFLRRLDELEHIPEAGEGDIFGTIDVVGLYPHIPHKDGLDSMKNVLSEFKEKVNVIEWYVDGVDLIELATLILENNYFKIDG